jgi:poly(3-hydroxybutyrate) depolymerase
MRSSWFGLAVTLRMQAATALLGVLLCNCSENNEGNITTPPPPSTYTPAASGGSSAGGMSGGGGSSVIPTGGGSSKDLSKPWPSSGCGKEKPADQVETIPGTRTGYTEYHVTQTGATLGTVDPSKAGERQFFVRVPFDYDQSRPYRIVYVGQGCGAQHAGKTNTYPLFNETQGGSEQAIYVGVSVPDNAANPGCYDNNSGPQSQEWEAFDLMHTLIESKFCVDNNRIYVAGYSTGGWLSNMWGCYFGGTPSPPLDAPDVAAGLTERKFSPKWAVRGHANVTGSKPDNQPVPCNGPSAGFWLHDALDGSNLIATNIAALNLSLQTNGCTGNYKDGPKQPWAPAEKIMGLQGGICQEYTGCPAETAKNYPLIFCTTSGLGHADQASSAIPAFTTFFDLMDPK